MRGPSPLAFLVALACLGCGGVTTRDRQSPGAGGSDAGEQPTSGGTTSVKPPPSMSGQGATQGQGGGEALAQCRCVGSAITWFVESGMQPIPGKKWQLSPCQEFSYSTSFDDGTEQCELNRDDCDSAYSVNTLLDALAHPDMQAALAAAPVVYGSDHRATGGQVDHIDIGGKVIRIGGDCSDGSCPIPQGVADFDYTLGRFTIVQLGACNADQATP